jgi:hypothetical protein
MTGRERLNVVLTKRPTDRMSWSALVCDATLNQLSADLRGHHGLDFYRHIGCDVLLLDGWGTPHNFSSPYLDWGPGVKILQRTEGDARITETNGPQGKLSSIFRRGHPVKPLVASLEEIEIYTAFWKQARYHRSDDTAVLTAIETLIGDQGVMTRFWGPSTIPRLLEYDMGIEGFYFLLSDHPEAIERLIELMHAKELDAFNALAAGPCHYLTLVENTSTRYISPEIYRRFNMPHQRDFVQIAHAAGKTAILHMCGHVKNLLPVIRETGADGIHALTPPPTGDTPWEMALDTLGDDTVIIGAIDPTITLQNPVEEIGPALDRLITPRLRRSHFVPCFFSDGIQTPLERFEAVARWMEKNR